MSLSSNSTEEQFRMRRKLATLPTGTVGYGSGIAISCDAFLINAIMSHSPRFEPTKLLLYSSMRHDCHKFLCGT